MVCSLIPRIGTGLTLVQTAWLYSLYSFEYKWSLENWGLEDRLAFCEWNWAYMLGFGFPAAVLTVFFSKFVGLALLALLFPIFIMTAIVAEPRDNSAETSRRYMRLPVFRLSKWVTTMVLRVVCSGTKKSSLPNEASKNCA